MDPYTLLASLFGGTAAPIPALWFSVQNVTGRVREPMDPYTLLASLSGGTAAPPTQVGGIFLHRSSPFDIQ